MKDFTKSFLMVAVTMVFFSVVSTLGSKDGWRLVLIPLWLVGALIGFLALVVSLVGTAEERKRTAAGLLVGLLVGSIASASTCVVNLRQYDDLFEP